MRVYLTVIEKEAARVPLPFLRRVIRGAILADGRLAAARSVSVSLVSVSDREIRLLNRTHRGKDTTTDILSFSEERAILEKAGPAVSRVVLGDPVVSPEYVARAAREDGVPYRHELAYVVAHGTLHLLGFDHEPRHFRLQDVATRNVISKHNGTGYVPSSR